LLIILCDKADKVFQCVLLGAVVVVVVVVVVVPLLLLPQAQLHQAQGDRAAAVHDYSLNLARLDAERAQGSDVTEALLFLAEYAKVTDEGDVQGFKQHSCCCCYQGGRCAARALHSFFSSDCGGGGMSTSIPV